MLRLEVNERKVGYTGSRADLEPQITAKSATFWTYFEDFGVPWKECLSLEERYSRLIGTFKVISINPHSERRAIAMTYNTSRAA